VELNLEKNNFTGPLPTQLGDLSSLEELKVNENSFQGEIPSSLANLEELVVLDLSENFLTGSIPPGLADLANLEELNLFLNERLNGTIPPALFVMSSLEELNLEYNYFSGMYYNLQTNVKCMLVHHLLQFSKLFFSVIRLFHRFLAHGNWTEPYPPYFEFER